MDTPTEKLTIPDVIARFRAYHEQYPVWGTLHIVLGDLNLDDENVEHAIRWAIEEKDTEGEALARILLKMSRAQRRKLADV